MGNESFGQYLKGLREEKNLNYEELAEKINVKRDVIEKWEKDKDYPNLEQVYNISEIFEIPCEELLEYREKQIQRERGIINKISQMLGISMLTATLLLIGIYILAIWIAFLMIDNIHKYI